MAKRRVSVLRDLVESRRDEIKAIVARHHGHSVAVFGSVARGNDGPASDIDFLVELEPDARPFEILVIGAELEAALGVPVDVGTRDSLRSATSQRRAGRGDSSVSRDARARLADIVEAIDVIREHLRRGGLDDTLVYDAVRVRLIEIGEAVKGLSPDVLSLEPTIEWKAIARMRDQLAHHYFDTDHAVVRDVVENELNPLLAAVRSLTERVGEAN